MDAAYRSYLGAEADWIGTPNNSNRRTFARLRPSIARSRRLASSTWADKESSALRLATPFALRVVTIETGRVLCFAFSLEWQSLAPMQTRGIDPER